MALPSGAILAVSPTATTGNVNGAGFNPANANFPTDLAATLATSASPVATSATYTFVAGDVGAYVYIKSGTNWIAGWYPIASVSAGAATLNAAVGAVVLTIGATGIVTRNTSAGCASVASPTAGTYGVDYSQQDAAKLNLTDLTSIGSSTTITSVTGGFTPVMVGNFLHQTTTGTGAFGVVGWYEVVSVSNTNTAILDRTPNSGTASVACTGNVGGAGRFNGLENTFFNMVPSASIVWVKNGSYTFSGAVSATGTNSTGVLSSFFIGYNSVRGDACNGTNRPIFAMGANTLVPPQFETLQNIIVTGTSATGVTQHASANTINCKFTNTSTLAGRVALTIAGSTVTLGCEAVSQNGPAMNITNTNSIIDGCYAHDSDIGIATGASGGFIRSSIIEGCVTAGVTGTAATSNVRIESSTLYGSEAKIGIGLNLTSANAAANTVLNSIFYGFATGISVSTGTATSNLSMYNDFFNNTTDVTNWIKDSSDLTLNPQFVGASQITGSTATTSGSVLTAGSIFSGINDGIDYLHVTSGTGVTTGCYLITSHTATTITVNNALGTSSGGDVVFWVTNGHNFQIGPNLANAGFPNFTNATGGLTTGYPDLGAVVRSNISSTLASTFVG